MSLKTEANKRSLLNFQTIKGKFILISFFILLGLALLLASFLVYRNLTDEFNTQISNMGEAHAALLTLRRHEKDFLGRQDLKYKEKFQDTFNELNGLLSGITVDQKIKKEYDRVIANFESYRETFFKLVDLYQQIGLSQDTGLRGALRTAIHTVEEETNRLNILSIQKDMLQLRRNEKDFIIRNDEKYVGQFQDNINVFLEHLASQQISDEDKNKISTLVNDYKAKFLELVEAKKTAGLSHNQGLLKEVRDITHKIEPEFRKFEEHFVVKMKQRSLSLSFIVFGAIAVLAIILFVLYRIVSGIVVRRLGQLEEGVAYLAQGIRDNRGDLTWRGKVTHKDEITSLGNNFNFLIQTLQENFQTISNSTVDIANASAELNSGSNDLATRTSEQAASITESSTILEKLNEIIRTNSGNITHAITDLDNFNAEVESNSGTVESVTQTMSDIDESGKKIDSIVNVINDISFQTNLLALNAAVEAARAGEAGRGFAVVAAEVRNLAQKTAESSKTIQSIVTQNVEYTNRGIKLVQQMAEFFQSILQNIQQINDKLKDNTSGLKEQNVGIEQLDIAISQIDTVGNQNASLSEELTATSSSLSDSARELKKIIERFIIDGGSAQDQKKAATKPKEDKPPKKVKTQTPEDPADFFAGDGEDTFEEF